MKLFLFNSLLLCSFLLTNCYTLRGSISPVNVLPLTNSDISSSKVILRDRKTTVTSETYFHSLNGEFAFSNVTDGSYLLHLDSLTLTSANKYRIDILGPGEILIHQVIPGHDTDNDLGPRVSYPILIESVGRQKYTIDREEFSLVNMVKSPMMLMSLGSLVMVFLLPKMAANIDPDTMQQLQEHQNRQNNAMDAVSNFDVAGFIAEKSK